MRRSQSTCLRWFLLLVALAFVPHTTLAAEPRLSEAAVWLRDYIRLDTTNPPGRENLAVDYFSRLLAKEGIPHQRIASPSGRPNLVARLAAPGSQGRAVLLIHHMDVVAAGPGWTVPPFAGLVRDGRLWGRGAVDDKSLGIAHLAAMLALKKKGGPRARDVIWMAVADEENGGGQGVAWLWAKRPDLFRGVEAVFGEGGANRQVNGRLLWWGIEVAQKRPLWLEVSAQGRGGHGSGLNPQSANHELLRGLARLIDAKPTWRVTPAARGYLRAIAPLHNPFWRDRLLDIDKVIQPDGPKGFLLPGLANLFLDTIQVTVLGDGGRINVIPEQAKAKVDIRLLPDTDSAAFLARVKSLLGKDLTVETLVTAPIAAPSPVDNWSYQRTAKVLSKEAPVAPAFIPGFTDSRFFRERKIPTYGLSPFALEGADLAGIHNPNERIPLNEFDRGVSRVTKILAELVKP